MDIKEKFKKDLAKFNLAPFLFVGSGFSRRYLGTESWSRLLEEFCIKGMKPYGFYFSKSGGKLDKTASLMAEDYHKIWFTGNRFKAARQQYGKSMSQIHSPLKYEIAEHLKKKTQGNLELLKPEELDWFKRIVINGIITTNWDDLLELLFPSFSVFVGQKDLLTSVVQGIGEIYKIHGSVSDFNSLVLTKEDYDDFKDKKLYLAAKLLTIIIEHPIIFIGYSIADENIRQILRSVDYCLSLSRLETQKVEDKLFFVQRNINDKNDTYQKTYITIGNRNQPATLIKVKDYSDVYKVLAQYERKISVKVLKQITSKLFEIVKSNEPAERIAAIDITDDTDLKNVDFAIGVGLRKGIEKDICTYGYLPFSYDDLLEDVMLDNKNYDAEKMVEYALSQIINRSHYTPFYKYLREGDYLDEMGKLIREVHAKIKKRFNQGGDRFITNGVRNLIQTGRTTFDYSRLDPNALMASIQIEEEVNLVMLRHLIMQYTNFLKDETFKQRSQLRKLIRIYDWLKFGMAPSNPELTEHLCSVRISRKTFSLLIIVK